jgi:exopolyphosphatase/guanosine-5'-triphosphate,3'-diphosphate pyrophosphatase
MMSIGEFMNFAAIDVGSNAIRMVVGRSDGSGKLEILESTRLPIRLGRDVFASGQLSETSMQSALDAFVRFRTIADQFEVGQLRAVATSALRESGNGDILIDRIARATGIQLEIISSEDEARLIHLAVSKAVKLEEKNAVLIDIGGGSVEVILAQGDDILYSESYPMGTVRLLQRLGGNGNIPSTKLLREYADSARKRIDHELGGRKVDICVGTGGNIEEMGHLRKKLFKGESDDAITSDEIKSLIEILSGMSVEERIKRLDLRPDRADVILPAAMVLHMIVREAKIKEVKIPGIGLKDGVLWDMLPMATGPHLSHREQVLNAAMNLGEKYRFDAEHARHVSRLAGRIFDQTLSLHGLNENDRLLLETAALLHDIGHFVNTIDHDQHGFYIFINSPFIGLEARHKEMVANLIRYHRKTNPSTQDESFKSLSGRERMTVIKTCALLRLADALEISHTGRLSDVIIEKSEQGWRMLLQGEGELMLERWSFEKRKGLFQDVFGISLEIRNDTLESRTILGGK